MKKTCVLLFIFSMMSTVSVAAQEFFPITHIPTIQVSGEASVQAVPDRATLFMSVSEIRRSVAAAKVVVDEKVLEIQKMMTAMGIEKSHINASELAIQRIGNGREPLGAQEKPEQRERYNVSRRVTVTLTDISQLDMILEKSVSLGINELWQVHLYSSREEELKLEAVRLATRDAGQKAEALAGGFQRKLGQMFMAEHAFGGNGPVYRMAMDAGGGQQAFARGTISISARVRVVYEVE